MKTKISLAILKEDQLINKNHLYENKHIKKISQKTNLPIHFQYIYLFDVENNWTAHFNILCLQRNLSFK